MGNLVHRFCNTGYVCDISGWHRISGETGAYSTILSDCSDYKRHNRNGSIQYRHYKILNYSVNPRYFSGSMDMKRKAITDRGIFGFIFDKSDNGNYTQDGATIGGLALYGYDDDNTDLYYYAWDSSTGGYSNIWRYLVNLESIGIDPYEYHTYRYMADLQEHESGSNPYGWYDGITIDNVGTVCPPHDNNGILDIYGVGNVWFSGLYGYDNNYTEDAWGGKNLTAYNVTGEKKFNRFPKWRKTSLGMRPFY